MPAPTTPEAPPMPAWSLDRARRTVTYAAKGTDLRIDLPLTLYEAALGGAIEVPTLDGAVEMTAPPNCAGKTLRLRGKGIVDQKTGQRGDQYVRLQVVLPLFEVGPRTDRETGVRPWFEAFTVENEFTYAGVGKKGGY